MTPVYLVPNPDLPANLPLSARRVATADTNANLIKGAAPGRVYGVLIVNASAAPKFVKLFDKATVPVPGTDIPAVTLSCPANDSRFFDFGSGIPFALGIGESITGAAPDIDTTALVAGDVIAQVLYL